MPMSFPARRGGHRGESGAVRIRRYTRWFNTCTLLANGATQNCHAERAAGVDHPAAEYAAAVVVAPGERADSRHSQRGYLDDQAQSASPSDSTWCSARTSSTRFNSPQFFSGPVTTVTSGNFGRISGAMDQSNLPRFIQFSMKLQF